MLTVAEVRQAILARRPEFKRKFSVAAGSGSRGPTVYYDPSLDEAQLRVLVNDPDVLFLPRGPTEIVTTLPLPKEQWI